MLIRPRSHLVFLIGSLPWHGLSLITYNCEVIKIEDYRSLLPLIIQEGSAKHLCLLFLAKTPLASTLMKLTEE